MTSSPLTAPTEDPSLGSGSWFGLVLRDRRVRFVLTGGVNALVGFASFVAFQTTLGERWGYMWALLATHITTVLFGFTMHRSIVFKARGRMLRDFWRFEAVFLTNLALNAILLVIAVEVMALAVVAAQAIIILFSAMFSWLGHSRFTFARSGANENE